MIGLIRRQKGKNSENPCITLRIVMLLKIGGGEEWLGSENKV